MTVAYDTEAMQQADRDRAAGRRRAVRHHAASPISSPTSRRPTIIVDTAPTGHFLRLLDLPKTAGEWVREFMRILLRYRELVPAGSLGEELLRASRALHALEETLHSDRRAVIVVTRPERIVVAETQRLIAELQTARHPRRERDRELRHAAERLPVRSLDARLRRGVAPLTRLGDYAHRDAMTRLAAARDKLRTVVPFSTSTRSRAMPVDLPECRGDRSVAALRRRLPAVAAPFYTPVERADFSQEVIDRRAGDRRVARRDRLSPSDRDRGADEVGGAVVPLRAFTMFGSETTLREYLLQNRESARESCWSGSTANRSGRCASSSSRSAGARRSRGRVDSLRALSAEIESASSGKAFLLRKKLDDEKKRASREAEQQVVAEIEREVVDEAGVRHRRGIAAAARRSVPADQRADRSRRGIAPRRSCAHDARRDATPPKA